MAKQKPILFLITGPNGAGKTTFASEILTRELKGMRFLNADEIARGLSPFDPPSVAFKAGRLLITEARELVENKTSFALESTISGIGHTRLIKSAKEAGYEVILHFLWLPAPEESIRRVRQRVKKGGHHVPAEDIRRRYPRTFENLVIHYLPIVDEWFVWQSQKGHKMLANYKTHAIHDVAEFLDLR
ncbi:MAG: zeta toxin family protein [Akkermansiaceae bacterium]